MNGQDIWLARDFALLSCRAENWIQLFINFFATFPKFLNILNKDNCKQKRAKEESNVGQISCFNQFEESAHK